MRITALSLSHYRNISNISFQPSNQVNLILGENGQGKTNLLESIWMLTGAKSFRGCQTKEIKGIGMEQDPLLEAEYQAFGRDQAIRLLLGEKKEYYQNKIKRPFSQIVGQFYSVAFTPSHLNLVSDGPEVRRKFLDATLCQFQAGYLDPLIQYKKALTCKNVLLRKMAEGDCSAEKQMDGYDQIMALSMEKLLEKRARYLTNLNEKASLCYGELSSGRETIKISYQPGIQGEKAFDFYQELVAHRQKDALIGHQIKGIHKDDILIEINGMEARKYASQGQKRSIVLAMKLSEADLLEEETKEAPVVLLDDVLSELDLSRQDYLLNHLGKRQLFITLCDPVAKERMIKEAGGKVFWMEQGNLREEQ